MAQLTPGAKAPHFKAPVVGGEYSEGSTLSLSDLQGQKVVLYFYPKDDTPGCTKQACALRDGWKKLAAKAKVFGVSIDSVKAHQKFITKFELPFPLISDEEKKIVADYGVWVEKSMYGKKHMGTERSTFVIDEQGKIQAVFPKVKPEEHYDLLLKALAE
jgi:thioredoxin-dependent peroxiredoxin